MFLKIAPFELGAFFFLSKTFVGISCFHQYSPPPTEKGHCWHFSFSSICPPPHALSNGPFTLHSLLLLVSLHFLERLVSVLGSNSPLHDQSSGSQPPTRKLNGEMNPFSLHSSQKHNCQEKHTSPLIFSTQILPDVVSNTETKYVPIQACFSFFLPITKAKAEKEVLFPFHMHKYARHEIAKLLLSLNGEGKTFQWRGGFWGPKIPSSKVSAKFDPQLVFTGFFNEKGRFLACPLLINPPPRPGSNDHTYTLQTLLA